MWFILKNAILIGLVIVLHKVGVSWNDLYKVIIGYLAIFIVIPIVFKQGIGSFFKRIVKNSANKTADSLFGKDSSK